MSAGAGAGSGPVAAEVLVLGAGIAGASAAFFLAGDRDVVILEREDAPGRHSTGRSAATYIPSYGPAPVRALTVAGRGFFEDPPPGFAAHPLLAPRGVLTVAAAADADALDAQTAAESRLLPSLRPVSADTAAELVPVLRRDHVAAAALETAAEDIDVNALHQGFLRGARARGARLVCDAEPRAIAAGGAGWTVDTAVGAFTAPVLVNAAGAWADQVAEMAGVAPIGLVPKRRTAVTFAPPADADPSDWPLVVGFHHDFYFKPEAGLILASPADETPMPPCDVQPDELDVALCIDRVQRAADLPVTRIAHKWAGLRSFVADGVPVVGVAPGAAGFFWLAGQGGYGIQTAPGLGRLAAALVAGRPVPDDIAAALEHFDSDLDMLLPDRIVGSGGRTGSPDGAI